MLPGWQRWIKLDHTDHTSFHKSDGTNWQRWIKLDRTSFHKTDVTRLAAMDQTRSHKLPQIGWYQVGSDGSNSIAQASTNRMLPGWQRWIKLDRTSFHKPDVTRLAAMDQTRSHKPPQNGCYQVGSDGSNSIAQASTNRMLPGWQRWIKLDRTSFHKPDITRLAAMDQTRSHKLPQTGCYQVGSDGSNSIAQASTNRMVPGWQRWIELDRTSFHKQDVTRLAATDQTRSHKLPQNGCYQVGSDGSNSIAQASTNRMLPGWQRWIKLDRTSFHKTDVTRLAAMDQTRSHKLPQTGCYQVGSDGSNSIAQASTNRMVPGWQRWIKLDRTNFQKTDVTRLAAMDRTRSHKLPQIGWYQVGSDGSNSIAQASTNRMLPGWQRWIKLDRTSFHKTDVTRLAAMDQTRSHKLPQTGCYQVSSDACFSNRMPLGTKCRQGWQRYMFFSVLASAACPSQQEAGELARAADATWLCVALRRPWAQRLRPAALKFQAAQTCKKQVR